jgi:hypothetical protein
MTVIVGLTHNGSTYIGGDRGASGGGVIVPTTRPKVGVNNGWAYGYSGSFGNGQLFDFLDIPTPDDGDMYGTLRLSIVEQYKAAIEAFGNKKGEAASLLIGAKGMLWEVQQDDWGVIEVKETATGSGFGVALGSLFTSDSVKSPYKRIHKAVEAACLYDSYCCLPVDIVKA